MTSLDLIDYVAPALVEARCRVLQDLAEQAQPPKRRFQFLWIPNHNRIPGASRVARTVGLDYVHTLPSRTLMRVSFPSRQRWGTTITSGAGILRRKSAS